MEDEKKALDEAQDEVVAQEESDDEEDILDGKENPEEDDEEGDEEGSPENEDNDDGEDAEDEEDNDDLSDEDVEGESPKKLSKPAQTPEENARYAAARREAEKKEEEMRKKLNNLLQANGYDTYDDFINSSGLTDDERADLEKEAKAYGYNVDEYIDEYLDKKFAKVMRKKDEATRLKAEADKIQQERVKTDLDNFSKNYPSVNVTELLKDAKFMKFAKGKTSTQSLTEIYGDYVDLFGEIQNETVQKTVSKKERSTGSGSSSSVTLNSRQQKMLKEWNARHPENPLKPEDFK